MSKPFVPTKEQRDNVEAMTGFGIRESDICLVIKNPETGNPIDEHTLRLHFREELDTGFIKAHARVAGSMYEMATKCENWPTRLGAAAFYLARRAGWKETSVQEHMGKDGNPIDVNLTDVRERIAGRITRLASRGREDEDPEGSE
jgi:hypothetical protein